MDLFLQRQHRRRMIHGDWPAKGYPIDLLQRGGAVDLEEEEVGARLPVECADHLLGGEAVAVAGVLLVLLVVQQHRPQDGETGL